MRSRDSCRALAGGGTALDCTKRTTGGAELNSIDALELPPETKSIWWIPEAFAMPNVGREALQDVLDKDAKTPKMRKSGCDQLWLVIAIDTGSPSAAYQVGDDAKSFSLVSQFDGSF